MNWHIETTADELKGAQPDVATADQEQDTEPAAKLVTAGRAAAKKLATELGGDQHLVTIAGHETTDGDGFRPGHVSITVSRIDPASQSE